jgi:hypothetical protein
MRTTNKALAAIAILALALSAYAADEKGAVTGAIQLPPPPRIIEPFRTQPLPPRAEDPSWLDYQAGVKLFGEKRLGEALVSFKASVDERAALFGRASQDIAAALAAKEASQARGSLAALTELLAARDFIAQDLVAMRGKAGGSILAEMRLLRERAPSSPLRGLIDATLLVVEERGLSRIGDSLDALKAQADALAKYPEAEFWMGKVYLAEGEARLAELQIQRAYDMRDSLEVEDDRFSMLESLAGIYRAEGDLRDYELKLREIADASDLFASKDEYFRNAMERTLANQGIDKFMELYRIDESFALESYSSLGELYLDAGRPLAVIYLAAAVDAALTREIAAIQVDSPDYEYSGLSGLESRILASGERSRFAVESGLWKNLVLLGQALAASGYDESAREIWNDVANAPGAADPRGGVAPWAQRAASSASRLP